MSLATAVETRLHKCSVLICSRISSFTECMRTCLWGCAWAQRCGGQRTTCRHRPTGESTGETLVAGCGLRGGSSHPLSLLAGPLIFSFFLFLIQGLTLWLRCLQFMTVLLPQAPQCWGYKLHWLIFSILCRYLTTLDLPFIYLFIFFGNSGLTFQKAARLLSKVV